MHFSTRKLTTIVFSSLFFQRAVHLHLIFISAFVHIHSPLLCLLPHNQSSRAAFIFLALVCPPHCSQISLWDTPSCRCTVPSAQCDTIECRNKSNARPKNEQQNIKRSDTKSKTNLKWKLLPTQILQGAQDNLRGHTPTHPSLPAHPSPHTITTHNTRIGMPSVRLWVAGLRVSNKCHDMKFIYAPRKPMKSNQSKGMQQQRKNRTAAITRASNAITMPQPKTIKRE